MLNIQKNSRCLLLLLVFSLSFPNMVFGARELNLKNENMNVQYVEFSESENIGIKNFEINQFGKEKNVDAESRIEDFEITNDGVLNSYSGNAKKVIIPNSVKVINLGVFWEHCEIEEIVFSSELTVIEDFAFYGCENIKYVELNGKIQKVGRAVFYNCKNLKRVFIGKNVSEIGECALFGCDSVSELVVDKDNKVYSSYNSMLLSKDKTELIYCPATVEGVVKLHENLEKIATNAFFNCTKITKVVSNDKLKYIDEYAFYNCCNLVEFTFGKEIKKVRSKAFECCCLLKEVVFPDTVTYVGASVLAGGAENIKVTFLNQNTVIGESDDDKIFSRDQIVTIYGYENSTAQFYAEKNKRNFVIVK